MWSKEGAVTVPNYIRAYQPGGTYFFTVVTHQRRPFLTDEVARRCLREAWVEVREDHPFRILGLCLMPDHIHTIWRLPENDDGYDVRWSCIKRLFSQAYRQSGGVEGARNPSRMQKHEAGFWQRRYWEHLMRDEDDFRRHMDYTHYNPAKHGYVTRASEWEWSTFHRYVKRGFYDPEWGEAEPGSIRDMTCVGEVI